jgi:alpha-amylase
MTNTLRFCLVLHNHQPIGNFDHVYEQAYQDSYQPFLDVFESFTDLRMSLHTSGPLLEWLDEHHPDYVDRLAHLVAEYRLEIVGGAFYEPILTMIPPRDRVGQIRRYSEWLGSRLGAKTRGMWIPERVWEQSLTTDLAEANIEYIVLDDYHFRNAGWQPEQLHGYYVTEDNGRMLSVFPGSEQLRYLIPFADPQQTIDHLRGIADRYHNAVVVFGDDGEKFGTWPDTKQHVYDDGWLRRFFQALTDNQQWLMTTTLAESSANATPWGKVYLPDASYREMTEWALPVERQHDYDEMVHGMHHDDRWTQVKQFIRGGFWRNFKTKYPESNEMYSRMMMVSRRLEHAELEGATGGDLHAARQALYRGQCNCSYWHGAFGGIYLPHLRNAVYNQLIEADNLLDQVDGKVGSWIEATADDYNFDARQEVRLANDALVCLLAPACGGQMYELDVRSIRHNLLATLARRPESYHRKVKAGQHQGNGDVSSIHDRVVFKQEGLDQRLQYDNHLRKSLIDHFYDVDTNLHAVSRGEAQECGDFVQGIYETRVRRNPDRIQIQLARHGSVAGIPVKITKGVTSEAGSSTLEIAYLLEGLPQDRPLRFGVEFNFAGLPSHADDRYFYRGDHDQLGQLHTQLDLHHAADLSLVDHWLGIDLRMVANQATSWWTYPIETVSQSEGGFELVHQSVVVQPHWLVRGDNEGRWSVTMHLEIDTSMAENRARDSIEAAVS